MRKVSREWIAATVSSAFLLVVVERVVVGIERRCAGIVIFVLVVTDGVRDGTDDNLCGAAADAVDAGTDGAAGQGWAGAEGRSMATSATDQGTLPADRGTLQVCQRRGGHGIVSVLVVQGERDGGTDRCGPTVGIHGWTAADLVLAITATYV